MATIKLCDWTKERLGRDDPTFKITVENGGTDEYSGYDEDGTPIRQEFEVGVAGRDMILDQLQSEDSPKAAPVPVAVTPVAPVAPVHPETALLEVEVAEGSLEVNSSEVLTEQFGAPKSDVPPLQIPEDVTKPLPPVSNAQRELVMTQSRVFNEGGLGALTPGDPAQRQAAKKLREDQAAEETQFNKQGGSDFRINRPRDEPIR